MKKIIMYSLFAIMLLIPFGVEAQTHVLEHSEDGKFSLLFSCNNRELIGKGDTTTCMLVLQKEDANKELKITFSANDDVLKFVDNNKESQSLIITAANNTEEQEFSVTVKNIAEVIKEESSKINISVSYDGNIAICDAFSEETFTLKPAEATPTTPTTPTTPEKPESSNNNPKPNTNNSVKVTSKGITNPNTADKNIILLTILGIVSIFSLGFAYKKIKN